MPRGAGVDPAVVAERIRKSSAWLGTRAWAAATVALMFGYFLLGEPIRTLIESLIGGGKWFTLAVFMVFPMTLPFLYGFSAVRLIRRETWSVLDKMGVRTCVRCGYDLRPTPVVVCCPECGEPNLDAGSEGPS